MPDSNACPSCGSATKRLGGTLCPACLVALAFDEDDPGPADGAADTGPADAYQVVSVIGREPGRTRYLARRQHFGALVSLEIISRAVVAGLSRAAITQRIGALRAMRHPSVARVLEGWQESNGDWCVASDFVAGRALAAPAGVPEEALRIFDRLCDAIASAHLRGVAHGRIDLASVVLVAAASGVEPRLTGFTLTDPPATRPEDIAALGRILVSLSAGHPFAADASALGQRPFADVDELRAAAARFGR